MRSLCLLTVVSTFMIGKQRETRFTVFCFALAGYSLGAELVGSLTKWWPVLYPPEWSFLPHVWGA